MVDPERRQDHDLRKTIGDYRAKAAEAEESAEASGPADPDQFLKLAASWTSLADALTGRDTRCSA